MFNCVFHITWKSSFKQFLIRPWNKGKIIYWWIMFYGLWPKSDTVFETLGIEQTVTVKSSLNKDDYHAELHLGSTEVHLL